jgi:hypothetical protein
MERTHLLFMLVNIGLLITIIILLVLPRKPQRYEYSEVAHEGESCSAQTCGATDPVSDPAFNMKQIAIQCILLEEHLTIESLWCSDCSIKHIFHCLGLANEANMLASSSTIHYPLMREAPNFFKAIMDRLLTDVVHGEGSRESKDSIAADIRAFRKRIVQVYLIDAKPI